MKGDYSFNVKWFISFNGIGKIHSLFSIDKLQDRGKFFVEPGEDNIRGSKLIWWKIQEVIDIDRT